MSDRDFLTSKEIVERFLLDAFGERCADPYSPMCAKCVAWDHFDNWGPPDEPAGGLTAPMCPECGWVGDFRTSPPPKALPAHITLEIKDAVNELDCAKDCHTAGAMRIHVVAALLGLGKLLHSETKSDRCQQCDKPLPPLAQWSMPSCPECVEKAERTVETSEGQSS